MTSYATPIETMGRNLLEQLTDTVYPPDDLPNWFLMACTYPGGPVDHQRTRHLLPRSDVNAAERISRRYRNQLSYGNQTGQWRRWNGRVHALDNAHSVEQTVIWFAKLYAEVLQRIKTWYTEQAQAEIDTDHLEGEAARKVMTAQVTEYRETWKQYRAFRNRLFTDAGQRAVVSQLRIQCAVDDETWDAEPHWLVVQNGVLDLRDLRGGVELLPHSPDRRVTRQMPVEYDEDVRSELWDEYLEKTLPNRSVREWLWKVTAYTLLGRPVHKLIVNLIGEGDTGKSVYIDTVTRVLGDYGRMVPVSTFLQKQSDSDFDRNLLKAVRFVAAAEPGKGKRWNDDVLKSISGRDVQTTAAKFQAHTSWKPQCTIFIASNHAVQFDTTDTAFLKRLKPVRFPVKFLDPADYPEVEDACRMDVRLEEKLGWEGSGILNWLIEGLHRYLAEGVPEIEEITREREQMQTDLEPVLEWAEQEILAGRLRVIPPGSEPVSHGAQVAELYSEYEYWAATVGEKPTGRKVFSRVMQSRYGPTRVSGGARFPSLVRVQAGSTP